MRRSTFLALTTVSFAALAATPGLAQTSAPATPSPAPACATLPAGPDRDACIAGTTTPVPAAEAPSGQGASGETTPDGTITVTGSRIRRDEFSTIEPITVITAEEITQSGFNSSTDALQSAEVTAGSGQINNFFGGFVTAGGTGANTLGLRNLGPARTLILLNGRRIAPAGTRGSVLAADLNVLPTAVVERIEVLKAGASSVYGSDAVAGVVNIITDAKVRGLTIDAQVNVPEVGAGVDKRISATFGFDTDRLNVIGSVEYRKRNALRLNDVDFTKCPVGGNLTGEGTEFGSGDTPGFNGSTCFTLENGGVTINTIQLPTRSAISRVTGLPGNFNRFVPAPGTLGGTPGFQGVNFFTRDTFDPRSQEEELITPVEIFTGFLATSYDLDALGGSEVYGEVLATRRKSSSLLYRQLTLDYLRGSPLLPLAFRNLTTLNPNVTSSGQFVATRAFIGFGLTNSRQEVDYVRAGGGLRGDFFFPGWRYDAYVGKSWTDGRYEIDSFLTDRLANSLNVVQNANGTFSCVSQASNPNCVPAPALSAAVIGGDLPEAFRDYILANTIGTTIFRETTGIFSVNGPLFELPGGSVQLALGAEYRKQRIDDTPDENAQQGNLFGLTASVPTRGTDNVKEFFGEVFVPLLADRPFFYRLNVNGSVRYTDYASYGSGTTYKVAGEYQPIRGIGFRGSYGTSYRAPALSEQFLGATSGFLGSGNDPCDADNFPANPANYSTTQQTRAANCAAVGIDVRTFQQNSGITSFTRGGAETGLEAETSRNWSAGIVVQPRISSAVSLSLALDYFDIKVENGVSALGGAAILNRCFSTVDFDPNGGFCAFVSRNANQALTVTSGFLNLSTDIVKGFEFAGRFSTDLLGGRFGLNANVTKYTEQSDKIFEEEELLDANGIFNTPDLVGSFDATYKTGPVSLRYGLTWIDGSTGTYDFFATSRLTGEIDRPLAQSFREDFLLEVEDYFLHTASVQIDIAKRYQMTLGVRNIFDKQPPRISAAVTTIGNAPLTSLYDFTGRQYFVNTTFKF